MFILICGKWDSDPDYCPGNVRELRNVLERAALLTDGDTVTAPVMERALAAGLQVSRPPAAFEPVPESARAAREAGAPTRAPAPAWSAGEVDLATVLARHGGRREDAARALGWSVRTLYRRLAAQRALNVRAG